ncbi:hypothetical protein QE368_001091 [Asaia bogorensis NBRC 16594]|nr:hypothetical protein [Asaia bogorensis NBRC 16594]
MADAAEQKAAHGDIDHGSGHVQALFVVADEASPPCHPAERAFHHPSSPLHLEALLLGELADNLEGEVLKRGKARQLAPVVGAIRKQVLEPTPALAHGRHNQFSPGRILHVRRSQVHHQQPSVRIHRDMALADPWFAWRHRSHRHLVHAALSPSDCRPRPP